jgi:DNA-binding NtrC family response regulator
MPAPVVIVHNENDAIEMLLQAVREAGYEAVGFKDPLLALEAIDADLQIRVLVTRVNFGEGKLNGSALARMLHYNRRRDIKVVFVGRSVNEHYVDGEGEFLPHPVDPKAVADVVSRVLAASE